MGDLINAVGLMPGTATLPNGYFCSLEIAIDSARRISLFRLRFGLSNGRVLARKNNSQKIGCRASPAYLKREAILNAISESQIVRSDARFRSRFFPEICSPRSPLWGRLNSARKASRKRKETRVFLVNLVQYFAKENRRQFRSEQK